MESVAPKPPLHPGEILRKEFLEPSGLTRYRLAAATGINQSAISDIVREKRNITPGISVRLARFWGNSPEFWMNLQTRYELELASAYYKEDIEAIVPLAALPRRPRKRNEPLG